MCMVFRFARWTGVGVWHRVEVRQILHPDHVAASRSTPSPVTWGPEERSRLRSVIDAARRELRDRTAEEIPARLRRVAASSARSLPPPLEKSLVDALLADDAFRSAVALRWADADIDDPVAAAFLDDPDAGLEAARHALAADTADRRARAAGRQRRRLEEVEAQLKEAKDRLGEARVRYEADLAEQRESDRAARSRLVASSRAAARDRDDARDRADTAQRERDDARREVTELRQRIESLQRRRRTDAPPVTGIRSAVPFSASDPAAIARHLDRVERMVRPFRDRAGTPHLDGIGVPFAMPAGVAPDTAEAIEAITDLGVELVVVDGYNLAGTVLGRRAFGREGRARVETIATALRRRTGAAVIVVYDAIDVAGRDTVEGDMGVESVFTRDRSADDEIVDIVATTRARTVVVTNDRDLRERCAPHGAIAVWSDAVDAWANP